MALILAVDPEQRQQAALACLARELSDHELISAPSCADALEVLDHRTPDLVLLPALLPESEEGELLSQLRGRAGADVQALTIPQLKVPGAAPTPSQSSAHPAWLNQILHPQDDSDQPGEECEPAVFADLVRSYLWPVEEAVGAVADAAKAVAKAVVDKRRTELLAAARATVAWVRSRRERWNDIRPAIAISAPPLDVVMPVPAKPVAPPKPAAVAVPSPSIDTAVNRRDDSPTVPEEFSSADLVPSTYEPAEPFAHFQGDPVDKGPGAVARAFTFLKSLKDVERPEGLDSIGPAIVRWLPKVAIVAVVLTIGVTGRAYWLKTASAPKTGVAVLESLPAGSQVVVDGQVVGLTPLTATLPPGAHRVDFKYRGKTRTLQVVINQGKQTNELVDWSPKTVGRLQVNSEPAGARVLIDNVSRGVTPLTLDDVPLGAHTVVLESGSGSIKRSVTIKSDEPVNLNETIYAGWLKVFAPFDITITEGAKLLRLDDREAVMLPAGPHDIRFENRALGYQETRHVEVQPGVTTPLSIEAPQSTLTLTTSVPADVIVDGVSAGQTPLTDYPIPLGTRDILLRTAAGFRRLSVVATVKPVVLNVDLSKQ
jgi:CheY-like chemotaxis protein